MSKNVKNDFSKNPLEMLNVAWKHFTSNEKMSEELKEEIRSKIELLFPIPEGAIMSAIEPFLESNIFEHDYSDLDECGLFAFIYAKSLSLVAGSKKNGSAE